MKLGFQNIDWEFISLGHYSSSQSEVILTKDQILQFCVWKQLRSTDKWYPLIEEALIILELWSDFNLIIFATGLKEWYFVSEIVLTYCEKKNVLGKFEADGLEFSNILRSLKGGYPIIFASNAFHKSHLIQKCIQNQQQHLGIWTV